MKATKQGYPTVPVLLKTDLCEQSYGPTKFVDQTGWALFLELSVIKIWCRDASLEGGEGVQVKWCIRIIFLK